MHCDFEQISPKFKKCKNCGEKIFSRESEDPKMIIADCGRENLNRSPKIHPQPGTHLALLLKKLGFRRKPNCQCEAHEREMNLRGCDWCWKNRSEIAGWLQDEGIKKIGIPVPKISIYPLILIAINNAKAAVASNSASK